MKDRFNLDLSVLDEIVEDIDQFRTSNTFLDHYEEELLKRRFAWEYCLEVLGKLTRWYDIVRLARHTRRAFQRYERQCLAMGAEAAAEAPDTVFMLEQADQRDPQGNPRELARTVKHLATLLRRCREVILGLMEENERLLSGRPQAGAGAEAMDERELALELSIPDAAIRRQAIAMMGRMRSTEEFVRMVQWLVNRRVVNHCDAHSQSFVNPFVPYLPKAKRLSRRLETLCDALREKIVMPE